MFDFSLLPKEFFNFYVCKGIFSFPKGEILSNFYLIQYIDGKIDILIFGQAIFGFLVQFSNQSDFCSVKAKLLYEKGEIDIKEAFISNISLNSNNKKSTYVRLRVLKNVNITYNTSNFDSIQFYLTNFLNNSTSNGSFHVFEIQNEDYEIKFEGIDNYDYYKQKLQETNLDVAVTSVANINLKNECGSLIKEMDKLTFLLSYSNKTMISPICFNYYNDEGICKTILRPIRTTHYSNCSKLIDPFDLGYFIEKCYPIFLEEYNHFSLNIIISIFLESLLNNYVDTGYVLLVQALESFLASYEHYCEKQGEIIEPHSIKDMAKKLSKFFKEKEFSISEDDLIELSNELAYSHTTTSEKLAFLKKKEKFKDNLNLNSFDYDFPNIRNKIVHTGIVPKEINSSGTLREINMVDEFNRGVFLFDKIILTLLDYDGKFNDYLNKKIIKF